MSRPRSVADVLAAARERLHRVSPERAHAMQQNGALLVDIRPTENRRAEGLIPDALVIDRNVLEWRLDPASDARLSVTDYERDIVLLCNEGYASSLAAAGLHDIGLIWATDLIGGFRAWRAAGLPVTTD